MPERAAPRPRSGPRKPCGIWTAWASSASIWGSIMASLCRTTARSSSAPPLFGTRVGPLAAACLRGLRVRGDSPPLRRVVSLVGLIGDASKTPPVWLPHRCSCGETTSPGSSGPETRTRTLPPGTLARRALASCRAWLSLVKGGVAARFAASCVSPPRHRLEGRPHTRPCPGRVSMRVVSARSGRQRDVACRLVSALSGHRVLQVAAGVNHSAAVSGLSLSGMGAHRKRGRQVANEGVRGRCANVLRHKRVSARDDAYSGCRTDPGVVSVVVWSRDADRSSEGRGLTVHAVLLVNR